MPETYRFGDLVEKYIDNRGKTPPLSESGIPLLEVKHLPAEGKYPSLQTSKYISQDVYDTWFRAHLEAGDILFSTVGTTGRVSITPKNKKVAIAQNVLGLRFIPSLFDPDFAFYYLRAKPFQHEIESRLITTVQASIKRSDMVGIPMQLPALPVQKAIASVLGALDDEIENNRRMNETLEEMARAIFKSWFVDFDPVHAKAAGNAPTHMDADTAALFPTSFGDDGLPAGWLELPLSDMTTRITKGTTPTKADLSLATNEAVIVNFLKVNMVTSDGVILKEKLEHIPSSIHLSKLKRSILKKDDILYSIAGTIGRVASVSDEILPANTNQALAIISPNTNIVPAGFIRLTMSRPDIQSNLNSSVVQGVQANLGLGIISNQVAVFPPVDQIFTIFEKIRLLLEKKQENQLENQTLIELRDTLLPKLMSGEIRVTDAEREVEAL